MKLRDFIKLLADDLNVDYYYYRGKYLCVPCGQRTVIRIAPSVAPTVKNWRDPLLRDPNVVPHLGYYAGTIVVPRCSRCRRKFPKTFDQRMRQHETMSRLKHLAQHLGRLASYKRRQWRPWGRVAAAALLLITAGCRSTIPPCPPCEPEIRVVEVRVPVPVPCHVPLIEPPKPTLPSVAPGDTRGTLEALLDDLAAWRRAFEAQRIAAEACAADGPPP